MAQTNTNEKLMTLEELAELYAKSSELNKGIMLGMAMALKLTASTDGKETA